MDGAAVLERLPPHLRRCVEVTGGGELLWPPDAVVEAIRWAADQDLAVLGIEVFIGMRLARGQFEREAPTRSRWNPGERWAEFAQATAAEAALVVERDLASRAARRSTGPEPMYFVATTSESDYDRVRFRT